MSAYIYHLARIKAREKRLGKRARVSSRAFFKQNNTEEADALYTGSRTVRVRIASMGTVFLTINAYICTREIKESRSGSGIMKATIRLAGNTFFLMVKNFSPTMMSNILSKNY